MTLRERAAKALGCYPLQVRFVSARDGRKGWIVGRAATYKGLRMDGAHGYGATQAEAVADLERKAQARQEG